MPAACHIFGWFLCVVAVAMTVFIVRARRGHAPSFFKKLDRDLLRAGYTIAGLTGAIGAMIAWLTRPWGS